MDVMNERSGRNAWGGHGIVGVVRGIRVLGCAAFALVLVTMTLFGDILDPLAPAAEASTRATITQTSTGHTVRTPTGADPDIFSVVFPAADAAQADAGASALLPGAVLTTRGAPRAGDFDYIDDSGEDSGFHVATTGVDFSKPWGVLFWFEGDGDSTTASTIPDSPRLSDLATVAAAHNMVLVVPDTPDSGNPTDVTWWEDYAGNGAWFRGLESMLAGTWAVDTTRVWFAGYSGGADFISTELLPSGNDWIVGGGAVMIGGGETPDVGGAHTPAMRSMPLTWYVGSVDGQVDSDGWSPLKVSTQGEAAWRTNGFTNTSLVVLSGLQHTDYDPAALVDRSLTSGGVTR